ncbi:glutaminase A [Sphingomonas crocodyli]|uniref:Glutaminase n=1 Tax=Sphingomonas crocodyli TaxID=1979270 RepID=A0A437LYR6_9SPHN|nr:glutaminase A [Sphingomonas crocodyli]RVT90486.1 glutaminase A [Sphingomonas crocodyli]
MSSSGTSDLGSILEEIAAEISAHAAEIEASADAKESGLEPGPFGIAVTTIDGETFCGGRADTPFPLQSIAKVFTLEIVLCAMGEQIFKRVGREPSGDPFNSIIDLERTRGIPRNPFVNAGALVTVDAMIEAGCARGAVTDLVKRELGRNVSLDRAVLASEDEGGDLNRAMLSFMRHHDNLRSKPDDVMSAYVRQCAISLDVAELSQASLFLARTRRDGGTEDCQRAMRMRKLLALMMTCGHYDGSGDFALRVGLPAKSGVGGGILAVVPEVASIAVWSPNLDQHGNSILGVRALEMLVHHTGWSVFGPPAPRHNS